MGQTIKVKKHDRGIGAYLERLREWAAIHLVGFSQKPEFVNVSICITAIHHHYPITC